MLLGVVQWLKAELYLGHRGDFLVLAAEGPHVVDGQSALLRHERSVELAVCHLRDAAEGAVLGGAEVDGGGPVVGEVLDHPARGAARGGGRVDGECRSVRL